MLGKKYMALGLYESGQLEVFFNPRAEGVQIPEHLKAWPQVKFHYGEGLPVPILDFVIDDAGISATLSFAREPFKTFLPWKSVYFMTTTNAHSAGNAVWPDDVPKHLVQTDDAALEAAQMASVPTEAPMKRERPAWMKAV